MYPGAAALRGGGGHEGESTSAGSGAKTRLQRFHDASRVDSAGRLPKEKIQYRKGGGGGLIDTVLGR